MKKVFVASLLTIACASALAASQQYRVYDRHQTGTPGSGLIHMPDGAWDKLFPKKKLNTSMKIMSANTYTTVSPRTGAVGDYIRVDGYHRVTIMNRTDKLQRYDVRESLSCDEAKYTDSHWVEVQAESMYDSQDNSFVTVQKTYPGYYTCEATTSIGGESFHASSDRATLLITSK